MPSLLLIPQEMTTKAGFALFAMGHLTSIFNFTTLLVLSFMGVFSIPSLYYSHQDKVDTVCTPELDAQPACPSQPLRFLLHRWLAMSSER